MAKVVHFPIVILLTLLASCTFEVKLKGVVIDGTTRLPVFNAQVRTLKGSDTRTLDFIDVHTDTKGKFEIIYSSNQMMAEKLWVEVSKENYLTNMYPVNQNSLDTITLVSSNKNSFDFFK